MGCLCADACLNAYGKGPSRRSTEQQRDLVFGFVLLAVRDPQRARCNGHHLAYNHVIQLATDTCCSAAEPPGSPDPRPVTCCTMRQHFVCSYGVLCCSLVYCVPIWRSLLQYFCCVATCCVAPCLTIWTLLSESKCLRSVTSCGGSCALPQSKSGLCPLAYSGTPGAQEEACAPVRLCSQFSIFLFGTRRLCIWFSVGLAVVTFAFVNERVSTGKLCFNRVSWGRLFGVDHGSLFFAGALARVCARVSLRACGRVSV